MIVAGLGPSPGISSRCDTSCSVTVFQPFRMATVMRGIALVLIAGRLVSSGDAGGWLGRMRAILLAVSVTGDWLMVVVTACRAGCLARRSRSGLALFSSTFRASRRRGRPVRDAGPGTELPGAPRHGIWPYTAPGGDRVGAAARTVGRRRRSRTPECRASGHGRELAWRRHSPLAWAVPVAVAVRRGSAAGSSFSALRWCAA